jgi:hypothetical protein
MMTMLPLSFPEQCILALNPRNLKAPQQVPRLGKDAGRDPKSTQKEVFRDFLRDFPQT